jgi:hypothetical protein
MVRIRNNFKDSDQTFLDKKICIICSIFSSKFVFDYGMVFPCKILKMLLKALSSLLNWRARLDSFDPLLKIGGPAIEKKFL